MLSLLLAGIVGIFVSAPASAGPVTPINVQGQILDPNTGLPPTYQLQVTNPIDLRFTFSLPDAVEENDQFTITFPLAADGDLLLTGFPDENVVILTPVDPAFPDAPREPVANCVVAAGAVVCTLTSYVNGRDDFELFSLNFRMQVTDTTDEGTVPFGVGGTNVIEVELPGGGGIIGQSTNAPKAPRKEGWVFAGDPTKPEWRIYVPVASLPAGLDRIVLTDTLGEGQTLLAPYSSGAPQIPFSVDVAYWDFDVKPWPTSGDPFAAVIGYLNQGVDSVGGYVVGNAVGGNPSAFSVSIPLVPGADLYAISYRTNLPDDLPLPATLTNAANGSGVDVSQSFTYNYSAGGSGSGNATPDLRVYKELVGTTALTSFDFTVSCALDGVPTPGSPFRLSVAPGPLARSWT